VAPILGAAELDSVNPIADMASFGQKVVLASGAVMVIAGLINADTSFGAGLVASMTPMGMASWVAGKVLPVKDAARGFVPLLHLIGFAFMMAGGWLAFVLPLIPMMRFFFGVISWLLTLAEAMMAVPLIAISMVSAEGPGFFGQAARSALWMLLALALRPLLMVLGLVFGLLIFSASIWLLNQMFLPTVSGMMTASGVAANIMGILTAPLAVVALVLTYAALASVAANAAFKAVDLPANSILRWVGGQTFSGEDGAQQLNQMMGGFVRNIQMAFGRGAPKGRPGK
jgi:conjugal transfer/type IV secretion protein DotA/TraY